MITEQGMRKVLVVVPTLNEARTIESVIGAISVDLPQSTQVTVVVADGGSTDGTVQRVQQMQRVQRRTRSVRDLRLMDNPKRLQSAAINAAVKAHGADADVLVRCDAHAQYPAGYVRRLIDTLDRTCADSVVVAMDSRGAGCFQKAVAWASNAWLGTGGSAHRGGHRSGFVDHGHHAAFRMSAFRRAGGYDETFSHNEDAELDCRQRRLGSKVYLDADIRIGYEPRATVSALARQYFAYGRGRSRTIRRHPGSMRARQAALPFHGGVCVASLAAAAWWPWLLLWPLAYLAALAFASVAMACRERSPCGLLVGPAAAVMHFSWAAGFLWGLAAIRQPAWPGAAVPPSGAYPRGSSFQ